MTQNKITLLSNNGTTEKLSEVLIESVLTWRWQSPGGRETRETLAIINTKRYNTQQMQHSVTNQILFCDWLPEWAKGAVFLVRHWPLHSTRTWCSVCYKMKPLFTRRFRWKWVHIGQDLVLRGHGPQLANIQVNDQVLFKVAIYVTANLSL